MTDSLFEAVAHATRELTKYGFSTQEFAMLVSGCQQPELVQYLKERRLYVNEPVESEEES